MIKINKSNINKNNSNNRDVLIIDKIKNYVWMFLIVPKKLYLTVLVVKISYLIKNAKGEPKISCE